MTVLQIQFTEQQHRWNIGEESEISSLNSNKKHAHSLKMVQFIHGDLKKITPTF